MEEDLRLRAAYAACRRIHRRHDPTYYWATRRLPAHVRPAVHAVYGYVRGADELVDGPGRARTPRERRTALDRWEAELAQGLAGAGSPHPVVAALVDAGRRHDLPLGELRGYMRSMRTDCDRVRLADREELERYMEGSTGTVGRIMAPLLGVPPERARAFGRLGTAFQLTNFIRDVREDYARLDRIYLPGVSEAELAAGRATASLRGRLADEVARARARFAETVPAVASASPQARPGMRVAVAVYLRVLDRVERLGFDVLDRRASLGPLDVGRALAAAPGLAGG
ncbi:MAG TPA: phytoene/squalene synthase family protein [Solirubrobacteraceae bacterium]|nr:phytoene/squalene synthase family protein [Solirubrobacteraceae bacterium]